MKRNWHLVFLLIITMMANCLAFAVFASENLPDNDTRQALELFQRGEQAYHAQNYSTALDWYQQAVNLHNQDGAITVDKQVITKSISYGRTIKQISQEVVEQNDYLPNLRIQEINQLLTEQQRRANPPALELQWISLREPTHDNILDGGESGSLVINVHNKGKSDALDVKLKIDNGDTSQLSIAPEFAIGTIKADSTHTANIDINAALGASEASHKLTLQAIEAGGFDSNTLEVLLQTKPHQPAKIELEQLVIQDFNGNGLIEPSESIIVKGTVQNSGAGVSDDIKLTLNLGENVFLVPGYVKEQHIGALYPGESKTFEYSFITNQRFQHLQTLPASLAVLQDDNSTLFTHDLGLVMHMPQNKVSVNVIPGSTLPDTLPLSDMIDVDTNIPVGKNKNKDAIAVIIGNRNYQMNGMPPVQYSLNDARTVKQYMIKTFGLSEHNIIYIENASAARFTETFGSNENFAGKLYNYVKPGVSDVFIYYSGHGAPDIHSKGAYFVPVDVDPNYIANSGYSLDLFYRNLSKIPARSITVALDTCFSGNSDGGFLIRNISPAYLQVDTPLPAMNQAAIFTSSQPQQISTWHHEKKHGLFTYYFLKGLSGAADGNADNTITTTELGMYLAAEVPQQARKLNGQLQTPTLTQKKELVLTTLSHSNINASNTVQ